MRESQADQVADTIPVFVFDVHVDDAAWPKDCTAESRIERIAGAIAAHFAGRYEASEAGLTFSSDARVRELNAQYRGKDRPTNVLSFPAARLPGSPDNVAFAGDIILARETIMAEAKDQGVAPADHVAHLIVHGFLHLLGFDHETDNEARAMEACEIAILAELGIDNPYREEIFGDSAG